jgi:hypothetical protein
MRKIVFLLSCVFACARIAAATPIILYSNLADTRDMAAASRPAPPSPEIEAADDFILNGDALVTEIKFKGLITGGALNAGATNLEIYRVFPKDSNTGRTPVVPTRNNSPSDDAFEERGFADLSSLTVTSLGTVTQLNSVKNGIHTTAPFATGGEGPVTGTEFLFDAILKTPMLLPADHYFFVPQISVTGGDFYWISASRPIAPPGTPINPDLQAWIRNGNLDPDWLRIGTDIVGGATPPTFNMAFEIDTDTTALPEPGALLLVGTGLGFVARRLRRNRS